MEEGVCARVRIRIEQEVAISRSAFQATLEIDNSPENVSLENLAVTLDIQNSADEPSNNLFGIQESELTGIADINGTGILEPGTSAKAVWTIIPTRDAAPDYPTQYYIGGTISYTEGGTQVNMPLFPASITVIPSPQLVLDYFLQRVVYSDDPFTPEIEPAEPYPLGLILKNQGKGTANNVSITSSQPEIIENEKGLLIDFKIIGTQVNTEQVTPSMTVDLGDLGPGQTAVAQWMMTTSLAGKFIEDESMATFEHINDLGMPQLSLIESVNIHGIIHAVRIDVPQDDNKPDFLANDIEDPDYLPDTLYSSDGAVSAVNVVSDTVTDGEITAANLEVTLTAATPGGWVYIRAEDPGQEKFILKQVIRSDGREIRVDENAWTTHRTIRLINYPTIRQHLVHLLDHTDGGEYQYTLIYENPLAVPEAPLMQFIPDRSFAEGLHFGFIVKASDPNGTIPKLSASSLPANATFTDQGNGEGRFDWATVAGDAGKYEVTFTASDGELTTSQPAIINIYSELDRDEDGMPDQWEQEQFGTLDQDGTGDFDGDGISDFDEYLNITEPVVRNIPADTDNDGMADEWEMTYFGTLDHDGTGDSDGDKVSDLSEYSNGTHPANPGTDTDSDGLPDDWETNYFGTLEHDETDDSDGDGISDLNEYSNGTHPANPGTDTDSDGIPDDWETNYFGTLEQDGTEDSDGDGISDLDEYLNGTDPKIVPDDTDNDGMADEWEMQYFDTLDRNGSDDFDQDGISDLDEYLKGTNPLTDTRGDINQDGQVNLTDAVIAIQIAAGIYPDTVVKKAADIDGDKKIGTEEAVYILRILSDIETGISGIISKNTVWTDFVAVTGDVTVADGVMLTVDPGTYVEFQGHYKLDVQGTLTVKGTPEQRITFTAKNKTQGWRGIRFDNDTGVMHDNPASELVCCNIHYGNATPGGRDGKIHDEKGGAVLLQNFSGLLISNCLITNNRAAYTGGGIRCYLSDPVIRNSIIANNTANIGGGVYCYLSEPVFTNNTVVNNRADIGGGLCFSGTSEPVLRNTAIWGNTSDSGGNQIALFQDEADPYFDYCNIQGGTAAFGGDGAGANYDASRYQNSISANPLFAEPSSGAGADFDALSSDWSLQAGSPCINAGDPDTPADEAGTEDFAGSPRISGEAPDIGAFEYQE